MNKIPEEKARELLKGMKDGQIVMVVKGAKLFDPETDLRPDEFDWGFGKKKRM